MQTSPTADSETERIQIVDENKEFTLVCLASLRRVLMLDAYRKDLGTQIGRWGLGDAGFGYDVVAVFGSQSTGKSTLLNRVFGTTFDVMDETQRRQTTKGMSRVVFHFARVLNWMVA